MSAAPDNDRFCSRRRYSVSISSRICGRVSLGLAVIISHLSSRQRPEITIIMCWKEDVWHKTAGDVVWKERQISKTSSWIRVPLQLYIPAWPCGSAHTDLNQSPP